MIEQELWSRETLETHKSEVEAVGIKEKLYKLKNSVYPSHCFPIKLQTEWSEEATTRKKIESYIAKKLHNIHAAATRSKD